MVREHVIRQIGELLDGRCSDCPKLQELNRIHGKATSHIDKHCHHQCDVGRRLRGLGQQLNVTIRPRVEIEEESEAEGQMRLSM